VAAFPQMTMPGEQLDEMIDVINDNGAGVIGTPERARAQVQRMHEAAEALDPIGFIRANWGLHARIAALSPNVMLRSLYTSLLDLIESHTLSVLPVSEQPLLDYVAQRYQLHADLVEAIADRDTSVALHLIAEHNTTDLLSPRAAAR